MLALETEERVLLQKNNRCSPSAAAALNRWYLILSEIDVVFPLLSNCGRALRNQLKGQKGQKYESLINKSWATFNHVWFGFRCDPR